MSEPDTPYVRHNVLKDVESLQQYARQLVENSDLTQGEVAEHLDLSRSVVAKSLNTDPERYQKTLRKTVELLSDYTVAREPRVEYRFLRKDKADDEYGVRT